jgi:hypothetical protein
VAGDSGSESVGDIAEDDEVAEVAEVPETVVATVAVERNEADEVRRKVRQACARRLTAVRGAVGASSSGSGSGLTVDLKRIRSHQLGTRCLLLESYTPLSSSSCTVPSPVNERVERPRETKDGAFEITSSSASSVVGGATRWPSSGVVGTLRTFLLLPSGWAVAVLGRSVRIMRGDVCALMSSANLVFARCAAVTENRLTSPPLRC